MIAIILSSIQEITEGFKYDYYPSDPCKMEAPFFGVLLSHKTNMEGPYLKRYGPSILVWETGPKAFD
jgi:hypothetical protein